LRDIEDPKSYGKAKMRATNHTRDKELVEAYESE
jgi:hypothetical protein